MEWNRSASVGVAHEEEASLEPDSLEPPLRFLTSRPEGSASLAQVPETAVVIDDVIDNVIDNVIDDVIEDKSWVPEFPSTAASQAKSTPTTITSEDGTVHFYEDGHYWTEMAGIPPEDQIPSYEHSYVLNPEYKKRLIRVRFSAAPIRGIPSISPTFS